MKSSTILRSMLSKESMDIIENLSGEDNFLYSQEDNTLEEYIREENLKSSSPSLAESKAKEIDMLWQSFKTSQFNTNSPLMCFIGGILTGIIATMVVLFLLGTFNNFNTVTNEKPAQETTLEQEMESAQQEVNSIQETTVPVGISEQEIVQSENETPVKTVKYVIKDGDTVEAIIKKHYGSYSPEKAEAIMKANNLKNLDRISIDQVLLIPTDK